MNSRSLALVVDADTDTRDLYAFVLPAEGFEAWEARDGPPRPVQEQKREARG